LENLDYRGSDVVRRLHQAHHSDIQRLLTSLDEPSTRIRIVVCKSLLHLRQGKAIRHQLSRIDLHLVFPGRSAKDVHVNQGRRTRAGRPRPSFSSCTPQVDLLYTELHGSV
jgi:hypothetical protein